MKTHLIPLLLRLAGAVFLSTAGLACSGAGASSPAPAPVTAPVALAAPAAPGAPLLQQIEAAIGQAACDTSAQCKTVAIGHKACGGPESYLAYSTKGNSAQVTSLAARYAAERKSANQKSGLISNCMMARDPGASCSAGRCVTGPGGVSER